MHNPDEEGCGGGFAVSSGDGYKFELFLFDDKINEFFAFTDIQVEAFC